MNDLEKDLIEITKEELFRSPGNLAGELGRMSISLAKDNIMGLEDVNLYESIEKVISMLEKRREFVTGLGPAIVELKLMLL